MQNSGDGHLDDLETILNAPPPALGAPLRQGSRADDQTSSAAAGPAEPRRVAAGSIELKSPAAAHSSAVMVPQLLLTNAHREGLRISPKSEVRCSITRAVVSPRSSDIAAAIQYRPGPANVQVESSIEQKGAGCQERKGEEAMEGASALFADRVSVFCSDQSSANDASITGWLPIRRSAGAAGSPDQTVVQQSAQADTPDKSRAPIFGTFAKMTVAASLVGAVAGGAAAGPLGLTLGEHQLWTVFYVCKILSFFFPYLSNCMTWYDDS